MLEELKIEITSKCMLNCAHCSTDASSTNRSFLSGQALQNILWQASKLGCTSVQLSGGEPFLYPQLMDLIKLLGTKGFKSKIYTSGIVQTTPITALDSNQLVRMKQLGLSSLVFSLFSHNPERHDFITGVRDSFSGTLLAVKRALSAAIEVEVHYVAMRPVIDDLLPLALLLDDLGVPKISVLRFVPQGRGGANWETLTPDAFDYIRLRRTLKILMSRKVGISCRIGSPFNFLLAKQPTRCNSGKARMIIDSDGFAYPCDALKQVRTDGARNSNVNNNTLSEIMQYGDFFRLIRETAAAKECRVCMHYKKCLGGCLAQRYLSNISHRDPGCLFKEKQVSASTRCGASHTWIQRGLL